MSPAGWEVPPKRILVVGVNWLGDLIFMTPAIRALRQAFPDAHLACLAPSRGLDLLAAHPHLDAVIPFDPPRGLRGILHWIFLIRRLKRQRYDAAFLFHRSFTRALVAWAAGIKARIGYRTVKRGWLLTHAVDPPLKDSVHKAEGFLQLMEAVGIKTDLEAVADTQEGMDGQRYRYEVGVLAEDHQAVEALLAEWGVTPEDSLVALHPGANWRLKRWPAEEFGRLGDALGQRYGVKMVFIGDKGELPLVQRIVARMETHPLVATGRMSFRQLGALLTRVCLLISNDSGPLHLGLAVGTPVIGLFGPTDPHLTGPPLGAKAITLFGSIGCPVPCYQLRCPVNLCMGQIQMEQVLAAASVFLEGSGRPGTKGVGSTWHL